MGEGCTRNSMHPYTHTRIRAYIDTYICMHLYIHTPTYVHTSMHRILCIDKYSYIRIYVYTYILYINNMYIYDKIIYMYVYICGMCVRIYRVVQKTAE